MSLFYECGSFLDTLTILHYMQLNQQLLDIIKEKKRTCKYCRLLNIVSSLYSFDFLCSRRCCTDELETLQADWTNVMYTTAELRARVWPGKIYLNPHPLLVKFLLTIPRQCFCCGLLFLSLYVFACISWCKFLFLIGVWPIIGKETVLLAFCL